MRTRDVGITTPCTADWRTMTPRDGGRFCAECKKVVRDLSRLSEREARALLAAPPTEGLCVRLVHDRFGNVVFQGGSDRLVPATMLRRAKRAGIALAVGLGVEACTANPFDGLTGDSTLMGGAMPTESSLPFDAGDATDAARRDAGAADAATDARTRGGSDAAENDGDDGGGDAGLGDAAADGSAT